MSTPTPEPASRNRQHLYVDGEWVRPDGSGFIAVIDSNTEDRFGYVPASSPEDVARAVAAARAAFPAWSETPPAERAKLLEAVGVGLQARTMDIAELIAAEVGMPVNLAALVQVGLALMTFSTMPQVMEQVPAEEHIANSVVVREPVGVVGAISPWNYPLHQVSAKVAPALAAGCTVVVKPSELAPLTAFVLADVMHEVGVPPGVFNLVTGTGALAGEALAGHPDIDMVSFTGSTRTGRRVAELAARTVKRTALELGGKSPNVILEGADLPRAVSAGVDGAFLNSGQTCIALSRMVVPRSHLSEVEDLAVEAAEGYTPGHALAEGTRLGPLVSSAQQDRVLAYIEAGQRDGAKLLTGGPGRPEGLHRGFFVRPTVFSGVTPDMAIAREEIFGPVLSIIPYDGEEEAVAIANDSIYGLSAAVWASDLDRARHVAHRIRAGQVALNGGGFNPLAPFGGFKQSGYGREYGRYGLEEYLEVKAIHL